MNSQILKFKGTDFEVQRELNNKVYSDIRSDSDFLLQTSDDPTINSFIKNRDKFFTSELIDFLTQTGIDYKKENEIHYYKAKDNLIISGWFDIIGKIVDKEKTETIYWENEDCTTNITFINNETEGIRQELKPHRTFRLSFDLVLY
jgi:hypothetical protein